MSELEKNEVSQVAKVEQKSLPAVTSNASKKRFKITPGKCPIQFVEKDGTLSFEHSDIKEPFNYTLDVLNQLTATSDRELGIQILATGANALPSSLDGIEQLNLSLQYLADSSPKDSTETRLCMQSMALYWHGMKYLKRAEGQDGLHQADHFMKNAIKLLRLHNETVEALSKYRRGGEQKVIVQHVNVNDGGKAVVGGVFKGGGGN